MQDDVTSDEDYELDISGNIKIVLKCNSSYSQAAHTQ